MIFYSIILSLLIILLVSPLVIRNIIKRSIDYFDFKLEHYNHLTDILAIFPYDTDPIIQRIAIQIPSIKFSYLNKRIILKINQFKLYLDLKVVELQVDKLTVAIVENKNQQPIQEFKQEKTQREITQMFKLFSTNRRYRLILPEFTFSTLINKDEKLEFCIKARNFYADLKNDFTKKLDRCVQIEYPQVNFHMPFGFTSDDCMNGSKIMIKTQKVVCDFSPSTCAAYKYIKYFRAYQARLSKFIRNDLVVKEKPSRSPMPKLVDIQIPSVTATFCKLENEITQQGGFLHGNKCKEVVVQLENVKVQVITKLHEYTTIKEIVQVDFADMNITAEVPTHLPIKLCHFQKGSFYTCRDYELKTLKILKTLDTFDQLKSEVHIHPVVFQLYEAYININQRPYLEFDFELYKTCLEKYIEECKKKYLGDIKQSFTNNVNATSNSSNQQQNLNEKSNPSSSTSTPAVNANYQNNQSNNNSRNQNSNTNTSSNQTKELKLLDYLVIDDKILLETILNTENVLETVTIPYLEQEFKTDSVEMYSYCGDAKISLTSIKPRFFSVQKEENSEYQGTTVYTFHNLLLEKFIGRQMDQAEKIFTMDSFQDEIQENNDTILQNMKFMLLAIQIKEETFKDVLDISNNFDIDYLDEVRQKKFVNPYQPPDPFTKPQKTTISLSCDFLGKNSEGVLKSQDQKTTLKGIKLMIGMKNQCNAFKKNFCQKNHFDKFVEDPNLSCRRRCNDTQLTESQQQQDTTKLNYSNELFEIRESRSNESRLLEGRLNSSQFNEQKQKNEDLLPPKIERYICDCDIQDYKQYDIFQISQIEYAIKTVIPQTPSKSEDQNKEYKHKFEHYLTFDTLTFSIHEDMKQLADYFQDMKESINRVKEFSLQLNVKFPKKEEVVVSEMYNQMFKEPLTIQWNNLSLIIEDSVLNSSNLNYQAFVRDYLQKDQPYNERHILLELKEKKKRHPLLAFYCKSLTLQLNPLKFATNFNSILQFIQEIDDFANFKESKNPFESFNSCCGEAGFIEAKITMRDYPNPILLMKKGKIFLQVIFAQLKIVNKSKSLRVFYNLLTEFGDFDLTVGLCQASGINQLLSRFKELSSSSKPQPELSQTSISLSQTAISPKMTREKSETQINEKPINRPTSSASVSLEVPKIDQLEATKAIQQKSPQKAPEEKKPPTQFQLPYWDNIRLCYHGKILMSKDSMMNFNLLTNIYPYQLDHLKFTIEQSFFMIREDNIKFYCQDLSIKRKPRPDNESHVLKIPLIQAECELDWNRDMKNHYLASLSDLSLKQFSSKKLNIFSKLNLPRVEPTMNINQKERNQPQKYAQNKLKRIVKNSEVPFIHYQVDFINWITNLPQLRRDQLYLYKIGIKRTAQQKDDQFNNSLPDFSDDSDNDDDHHKTSINKDDHHNDSHSKTHRKGSKTKKNAKKVEKHDLEDDEDEQEKALGKNTDFFSLLAYSVNQQLNSKSGKQNILKHISEIKTCALMSSTRVIFSNVKHKLVSDPEEDDDPFATLDPIIGMQFVFDSIQLSFNINHKPNSIKSDKQSFKMYNGYGKLDFMYGSVFKSKGNLLNLDPQQFRTSGDKQNSMYNPQVFANYFGVKDMSLAKDMMIFKIQDELYKNFASLSCLIKINEDQLKIPKTDYSRHNEFESDEHSENTEQNQTEGSEPYDSSQKDIKELETQSSSEKIDKQTSPLKNQSSSPKKPEFKIFDEKPQEKDDKQKELDEFDFNISSIFFRSDSLIYEQDKSLGFEVQIQDENGVMHKEITPKQIIKNCLSFKGCKLLITSQLNNIVNNVFFSGDYEEENTQQLTSQAPQNKNNTQNSNTDPNNSQNIKQNLMEMINSKLQLRADQSDGKIQTRLKFVLQIEDPQFNLYYKQQKNQMILTSREKCFIMIQSYQLPYDKQKVDLKHNFKLFFRTLDCFAVRKKNQKQPVRWVHSYDDPTHSIFHIIRATHTVINYTTFNLTQCIIDFSKPYVKESMRARRVVSIERINTNDSETFYKWNGQPRSRGLDLRVENLFSEVVSKDYHCFIKTLEFFSLLLQSEVRQKIITRQLKQKKNELKNYGMGAVNSHIQKHLHRKQQDTKQQDSHISYSLQTCIIKVLDIHRKPFLDFRLPSLKSSTINFSNNSGHFSLIFGQVTLKNLMEDGDFRDMIQYSGNDLQIRIENDFVDLKGIDHNTEWRAYNRYECFVPPLTVKLTENIYDPFYDFLFKEDLESTSQKNTPAQSSRSSQASGSSSRQPPPTDEFQAYFYFGKVIIKDLRICLHYKSQSSFKRLNGVSAIIQPYIRENMFNTNKELFDDFVSYLKKQVASQIFSLLGQKLFGYSKNLED